MINVKSYDAVFGKLAPKESNSGLFQFFNDFISHAKNLAGRNGFVRYLSPIDQGSPYITFFSEYEYIPFSVTFGSFNVNCEGIMLQVLYEAEE